MSTTFLLANSVHGTYQQPLHRQLQHSTSLPSQRESPEPTTAYSFSTPVTTDQPISSFALHSPIRSPTDGPNMPSSHSTGDHSSHQINDEHSLREVLSRITINGADIAPRAFNGVDVSSEKAEKWLKHFSTYCKLRALSEPAQIDLFSLLMTEDAADWLHSSQPSTSTSLEELLEAFQQRYSLKQSERWSKATFFWSREQAPHESVDKFITDQRNAARSLPINEDMLLLTIIKGLQPEIRKLVIQSNPTTMEDLIETARRGEAALAASQPSSREKLLQDQVDALVKLATKSSLAAIDNRDSTRHVSFEGTRNNRGTPSRSPSPMRRQPSTEGREYIDRPSEYDSPRPRHLERELRQYGDNHRRQASASPGPWRRSTSSMDTYGQNRTMTPTRPSARSWTSRPPSMGANQLRSTSTSTYGNSSACQNCNRVHDRYRDICFAQNLVCHFCGFRGHIMSCCRKRFSQPVSGQQ